jgi:hypothetical protein
MAKVNNSGVIPFPELINFRGEICYFKRVKHKFGIYKGLGMSLSVLQRLKQDKSIIFVYRDGKMETEQVYKSTVKAFIDSEYRYANTDQDVQKIVKFEDMVRIQ